MVERGIVKYEMARAGGFLIFDFGEQTDLTEGG
jgi:hypothetical protein